MSTRLCSVEGCIDSVSAKGLCLKHYNAYARRKRLSSRPNPKHMAKATEKFWTYVQKTETCWFWLGGKDRNGYGWAYNGQRKIRAHRYAYELENGPLKKGEPLCHTCDNPACVNPDHLWRCSQKEINGVIARKTWKHLDTEATTGVPLRWFEIAMSAEALLVFERLSPEERGRLITASLEL